MIRVELFQRLIQKAFLVFQSVSLIYHQTGPVEGAELSLVFQTDLISGQQSVELGPPVARVDPLLGPDDVSTGHVPDVGEHVHVGGPLGELVLPRVQGGQGDHHEIRAVQLEPVEEVVEEGDGLNGLAEAHLVCEDHAVPPTPGVGHPVEAGELVISQPLFRVTNKVRLGFLFVKFRPVF